MLRGARFGLYPCVLSLYIYVCASRYDRLCSFNTAIIPDPIINALNVCVCVLQIRQEKPYYIADPEVDSLVSISLFIRLYTRKSETFVMRLDIVICSAYIISSDARHIGRP